MAAQEPCYQLDQVQFRYPGRTTPTLHGLSFTLYAGERVLISGASGSGKSTLLRLLAGLVPHFSEGELSGTLLLQQQSLREQARTQLRNPPGMVLQSPDAQLCTGRVLDEVRFGLENLNLPEEELAQRTREALEQVGLWELRDAETAVLSGGQKQRLVIGATLAMRPAVLLLDEPISQLDPQGAHEVLTVLEQVVTQHALTLVFVEHRLEQLAPLVDRVLLLEEGRLVWDGPAPQLWQDPTPLQQLGLEVPFLPELFAQLQLPERPLRWQAALPHFYDVSLRRQAEQLATLRLEATVSESAAELGGNKSDPAGDRRVEPPPLLRTRGLSFSWPVPLGQGPARPVLQQLSLELWPGERVALLGANGSGKSSLLACLGGLQAPSSGVLEAPPPEQRGLLVQEPDLMLLEPLVRQELSYSLRLEGMREPELSQRTQTGLEQLQLLALADEPPQSLSRGQRLRVVLAALLTRRPKLLLLDEPTAGQNRGQIGHMMQALRQQPGLETLVFVTHDLELALRHATRLLVLEQGKLVLDLPREAVMSQLEALCRPGLRWPGALLLLHALRQGPPSTTLEAASALPQHPEERSPGGQAGLDGSVSAEPPSESSLAGVDAVSLHPGPRGKLEQLDARLKLSVVLCAGLMTVTLEQLPGLLLLVGVGVGAVGLAGLRPGALRSLGLTLLAASWGTILGQGLFYAMEPRTVGLSLLPPVSVGALELPEVVLYREGLLHGVVQSLRFSALILLGAALCASTAPERLFQALRWLRVPYGLSFMAVTAVRFLPLTLQELQLVRAVQRLRGYVPLRRGLRPSLEAELGTLRPLLMRTLRRSAELATALTLRGFDAVEEQPELSPPLRGWARGGLMLLLLVTLSTVLMKLLFVLYREEVLFLPVLRPLYGWIRAIL